MTTSVHSKSSLAILGSLPWCCILPGFLVLVSLSGSVSARLFFTHINLYLLFFSLVFLGWAHFLIHFRKQGNRFSKITVWISTFVVALLWLPRFL